MAFQDHSTHGPVSVIGLKDKIYLNHPITSKENEEVDPNFYLHCMALNREEAQDLVGAIQSWLKLGEQNNKKEEKYFKLNCQYCGSVDVELFDKWETGRLFCYLCYMIGGVADIPNPSNRTLRNDALKAISFVGNEILKDIRKNK